MVKIPFVEVIEEDRRLQILMALEQAHGYALNEQILKTTLSRLGPAVSSDGVRVSMEWLAENRLISIEKLSMEPRGELWIGTLLENGQMVCRGRPHHGILRPSAR